MQRDLLRLFLCDDLSLCLVMWYICFIRRERLRERGDGSGEDDPEVERQMRAVVSAQPGTSCQKGWGVGELVFG